MKAHAEYLFKQPLHKINDSKYRIGSDLEAVVIDGILHIRQLGVANYTTCSSFSLFEKDISLLSKSIPFFPSRPKVRAMTVEEFERMYKDNVICRKCFAQLDFSESLMEYL